MLRYEIRGEECHPLFGEKNGAHQAPSAASFSSFNVMAVGQKIRENCWVLAAAKTETTTSNMRKKQQHGDARRYKQPKLGFENSNCLSFPLAIIKSGNG